MMRSLAFALLFVSVAAQAQYATCYYGAAMNPIAPNPTIFERDQLTISGESQLYYQFYSYLGGGLYPNCNIWTGAACMPDPPDLAWGMQFLPTIDYALVKPDISGTYFGWFGAKEGVVVWSPYGSAFYNVYPSRNTGCWNVPGGYVIRTR